jgi:hypothetical protein
MKKMEKLKVKIILIFIFTFLISKINIKEKSYKRNQLFLKESKKILAKKLSNII